MTGGFSCSHLVECLCECGVEAVVWPTVRVCVCLPLRCAVSLSLPPGSEEPPSSRSVIGQGSGVLDTAWCWLLWDVFQQMVEVRECHHIGERIRGERLSSRSCLVPLLLKPSPSTKIQTPPWAKADLVKKRGDKTERNRILASQSASTFLSSLPGTVQLFFYSFTSFFVRFPVLLQSVHVVVHLAVNFWFTLQSRSQV